MAGKSALHALITENRAKEIEKLVKKDKKTLNDLNDDGQPPLVAAIDQGRCSLAELLARLGADINGTDTRGWNALHIASLNADLVACTLLLTLGANPNAATRDSLTTPLHYIVRHPYSKELENVMEMMFERKANPELKNGHGETPLHYSVMRCNEMVTRILLRHGADVNASNGVGETPLHKAARLGGPAFNIARILIASGASLIQQSRNGMPFQLVDQQYPDLRTLLLPDLASIPASPSASSAPNSPPVSPVPSSTGAPLGPSRSVSTVTRTGPDGQQMVLPAAAATAMPTPAPQPLPSARPDASAGADEEVISEEGVATLISNAIGFRVESGKRNALTNVELNLYDYTDHYRTIFAGKKQLHYVGYLTADESDPTVISVLLQSETGKYPEPVHRGIVRTKSSGQDLFFIPASDVAAVRVSRQGGKGEKEERELFALKLQTYLQDTFFMGCRLWLVGGMKDKKEADAAIEHDLIEFEHTDPERSNCFAFGVVYAKDGQSSCKEYWENEHGSPGFEKFLSLLGDRVTLKGWTKFRGGMDVANDSKGKESVYTHFEDKFEVMFHVSTLLPFHPLDPLKLVRARQIQNDVVVLIYQEGNTTYNPETMPTNVAHVFAIVRPFTDPHTGETKYRLGVVSKKNVNSFRPDLPFPPVFNHDARFRHFLLTKLINGQIAARKSGLQMMFTRPRAAMLDEIVKDYRPQDAHHQKPKKSGSFFGGSKSSDP